MNNHIQKLYDISLKPSRKIIGLMSGTSLDGLDVALCEVHGHGTDTKVSLLKFKTLKYESAFVEAAREICFKRATDLEKICLMNEWIATEHAAIVNNCLSEWGILNSAIDLVASHGQTIYHAPRHLHQMDRFPNGTLQIGDGDHIAVNTGIITVSDFRQKQLASGGEGAPLAAYGDYLLFHGINEDIVLLNIGGIANFTYLPKGASFDKIVSTDTGPGNTLMDAWAQDNYPGKHFDEDASIAKQGQLNPKLLQALMDESFFHLPFPKTTGPEMFNAGYLENALLKSGTASLPDEDVMATLNHFTAETIVMAIDVVTGKNKDIKIFVSGGGIHNPMLLEQLSAHFGNKPLLSTANQDIPPDAKEAVLFALLANECVAGNPDDYGIGSSLFPATAMGKISLPR